LVILISSSRGSQHGQDHDWAEQILQQSERLSELLDDVLSASMIADSAMILTPRALDVPAIVAREIGALPAITPTIAIEAALPPNLPSILADREKLMQILMNLLTNAVKYSPDGGEIRISAAEVNGRLRLSVIDHGLGITQDDLPRLFERFHSIHARTNPEIHGTGLGLYISRGLAELQGGILWGESQGLGMGSAFHLELPLAPADEIARATVGRASLAIGASR
jgi:signal transduction histidine kinase